MKTETFFSFAVAEDYLLVYLGLVTQRTQKTESIEKDTGLSSQCKTLHWANQEGLSMRAN